MKAHGLLPAATVLAALCAAACASQKARCPNPSQPAAPVLLVGIDGATWDVVDAFIDQGELREALQRRLRGRGSFD